MENRQKASSVIAKLMEFDETPSRHQPVYGKHKVFSENYLQKSGYIGKRSRKDSENYRLRSKKRANMRTNDLNNNVISRDFEQRSTRVDGMQGVESRVDFISVNSGENAKLRTNIRPNLVNGKYVSGPSFLTDSRAVFAWEVKKQLLERLKMTKISQEIQSDFASLFGVRRKEGRKYESVTKLPILKRVKSSSSLYTKYVNTTRNDVKQSFGKLVNSMSTNIKKNHRVSNADSEIEKGELFHGDTEDICNLPVTEGCSSHLSDISSKKDSRSTSHEDGLISSNCVQNNEKNHDSEAEMYQHSPNSVLEPPFGEDNSSGSEYCGSADPDLHDLWMQLQLFKSESEENEMNPEMITSSDDERSCTDQNISSMIPFGTKESRDFSYLVDVLDESGFQDGNVEIRFEKWHSSEIMAGPLIFETLEKKYGKQELWHKAERRLLFDRINAGMTEILRPQADIRVCSKPLRRKIANMLRRDVIEEELMTFLLGQEMGVDDGVSEKAVGRGPWFDPVDEVDSLVREIEIFLFDQLATELLF